MRAGILLADVERLAADDRTRAGTLVAISRVDRGPGIVRALAAAVGAVRA